MSIAEVISTYWKDIVVVVGSIVMVASIVVKLTPSKKDDEQFSKIMTFVLRILNLLAMNPKHKQDVDKIADAAGKKEEKK